MKVYLVTDGEYSDYHVSAVFAERSAAKAFIKIDGGRIEVWDALSEVPAQGQWYVIEEISTQKGVGRRTELHWPWESPSYFGHRRRAWNYSKWQYGERAWGMNERAVEKAWTEQHMTIEAREAGL